MRADLTYTTEYDPYRRAFAWRRDPYANKGTYGGTAIQFGACRDNQASSLFLTKVTGSLDPHLTTLYFTPDCI